MHLLSLAIIPEYQREENTQVSNNSSTYFRTISLEL
jgi:hypothetical protein